VKRTLRGLRRVAGVVPFGVYVTLFLLAPMVAVTIGAFESNNGGFTLSNVNAATHGVYLKGFWQSIILSVLTSVIPGVLGLIIAYAIFTAKRGRLLRQVAITAASAPAGWSASGSPASASTRTPTASPSTR
jgi:putative spermidine/putrescine transport system permease protein